MGTTHEQLDAAVDRTFELARVYAQDFSAARQHFVGWQELSDTYIPETSRSYDERTLLLCDESPETMLLRQTLPAPAHFPERHTSLGVKLSTQTLEPVAVRTDTVRFPGDSENFEEWTDIVTLDKVSNLWLDHQARLAGETIARKDADGEWQAADESSEEDGDRQLRSALQIARSLRFALAGLIEVQ